MSPVEPGNSESDRLNESSPGPGDLKSAPQLHVSFGLYEFNLQTHELRKGGLRLKIPHQSFQILAMLLEKPGQVVSREDLRRKLWPSDVFVNFESSLNSAVQRLRSALQDTSLEPRYIETLPRVGYRFIASVESLVPVAEIPVSQIPVSDESLQSAAKLESAEFSSVDTTLGQFSTVQPTKRRIRSFWAAAALLLFLLPLVLLVAYGGYRYSRRNQPVPKAQAQPSLVVPSSLTRRSVAVMGFTNASGNARDVWLSTAFTEMLATELAAGDHLRTVSEEDIARAKLELSLTNNKDSYGGNTLNKIRKDIGCDYVVAGSYLAIGQAGNGRLRLDARLQDAVTGDTVASVAVVGSQSDLFDLASRAGEQLRAKLGVEGLTSTEAEEVNAVLPANPDAARLYSDALAKLRVWDNFAARVLLEKVIRLDPKFAPAHSGLASALYGLGYQAIASAAGRQAMDLSGNLPNRLRLETAVRYYETNGHWTEAIGVYSRLQQIYPDHLDYGLGLARAQFYAMDDGAEAARATIAFLRKLPSPQSNDPRIDLTEAVILGHLGDFKREQALAESAAKKSEEIGALLLLAKAKQITGDALDDLGDFRGALDAYGIAERLYTQFGNLDHSAEIAMNVGLVLGQQGDLSGAQQKIEQAAHIFRTTNSRGNLCAALSNLGDIYRSQGQLPKAETVVREALAIFDQLNLNATGHKSVLTYNLAALLQRRGRYREARNQLEPLVENLRHGGDKSLLGAAMGSLGSIAEAQGEMSTALPMYQEAVSLFKETGYKPEYAGAMRSVGKALFKSGDIEGAKQALSEALSTDRANGAKASTAIDQVAMAEVSPAQAPEEVATLRSAIEELRSQKMKDDEIEAELVLAREMVRQRKTSDANRVLLRAVTLAAKSYDPTIRFDVALATAYVQGAEHRLNDASRTVRSALRSAVTMGCVRCQLEARLELGEIEIQSGNAEQGYAQLHELADEAGRRGFRLIAERAAADAR
jgi:DNA-binding winged helix-turn-helix (wHTH) protein/tetratricopeptide (TPR) repeat protein